MGKVWQIWLHPRAALREIEELRDTNETLGHSLHEAEEFVRELRGQLEASADTERHLKEIEDMLSAVGEMKERYEERISRLRAKIAELKQSQSRVETDRDEHELIDMLGDNEEISQDDLQQEKTDAGDTASDQDWLEFLDA